MRRAKKARKGNDQFALWSIAAFELARRIDPLDRRPIEANVGLLSRDQPIIANLLATVHAIIGARARCYRPISSATLPSRMPKRVVRTRR